eukprot:TRINITY_DN4459_c0_g1_i2.p2 TRINITY_DN4459_c0_g1~~TRINITY_DN4459_c0_g1_i2.p2  ORF type:complete len:122 (-),score=24.54 TRINITY_DN4459_c0_g1_i2:104-469(-)
MKAAAKSLISLTEAAASRMKGIYAKSKDPTQLLKLSVTSKGCLGSGYNFALVKESERTPFDEIMEERGVKFLVDSKSFLYLVGTTIDYSEDDIEAKFVYSNPNVKVAFECLIGNLQLRCQL